MTALVDALRSLPLADAEDLLRSLTVEEAAALAWEWRAFWARPEQVAPAGRWRHWLLKGGRGGGKSTALTQWIIERARAGLGPIRLIGGTLSDVRKTVIEHEETGILALSPPWFRPSVVYDKNEAAHITWPNGVIGDSYSAERPKRLRGKQSRTDAYDDLAGMGPRAKEVWDMAQLGNRMWGDCRSAYTTTPEDVELIVHLMEGEVRNMVRSHMRQAANVTNLTAGFVGEMEVQYGGTEQGARELDGILVRQSKESPFHGLDFADAPIRWASVDLARVVLIAIGVDPAEGAGEDNDEWGIVVVLKLDDGQTCTAEDLSDVLTDGDEEHPGAGDVIVRAAEHWQGACPAARVVIVAEINRGEERVRTVINAASYRRRLEAAAGGPPAPPLPEVEGVKAKEGKVLRAGPVRPLLVAGTHHHLPQLEKLEGQAHALKLGAKKRKRQDDRIDAEVHAVLWLVDPEGAGIPGLSGGRFAGVGGVPGRYHDDDARTEPGVGVGGVEGRNADPRWER